MLGSEILIHRNTKFTTNEDRNRSVYHDLVYFYSSKPCLLAELKIAAGHLSIQFPRELTNQMAKY